MRVYAKKANTEINIWYTTNHREIYREKKKFDNNFLDLDRANVSIQKKECGGFKGKGSF